MVINHPPPPPCIIISPHPGCSSSYHASQALYFRHQAIMRLLAKRPGAGHISVIEKIPKTGPAASRARRWSRFGLFPLRLNGQRLARLLHPGDEYRAEHEIDDRHTKHNGVAQGGEPMQLTVGLANITEETRYWRASQLREG